MQLPPAVETRFESRVREVLSALNVVLPPERLQRLRLEYFEHLAGRYDDFRRSGLDEAAAAEASLTSFGTEQMVADSFSLAWQELRPEGHIVAKLGTGPAAAIGIAGCAQAVCVGLLFYRIWFPPLTPLVRVGTPQFQGMWLPTIAPLPDLDLSTYVFWSALMLAPLLIGWWCGRLAPAGAPLQCAVGCAVMAGVSALLQTLTSPATDATVLALVQATYWIPAAAVSALFSRKFKLFRQRAILLHDVSDLPRLQ